MTAHVPHTRHRYTYEEYLAFERDSALKHEYLDGEIFAMPGGSLTHSALASRISAALENGRPYGCTAFQSDMRLRVLATGRAAYPDASMVCGPIELDPADPSGTTITNPTLLVEVLSRRPKRSIAPTSGVTISVSFHFRSTCSSVRSRASRFIGARAQATGSTSMFGKEA